MSEPRIVHVGANEQEVAAKHKAGIEAAAWTNFKP